jgi:hypothetical protein
MHAIYLAAQGTHAALIDSVPKAQPRDNPEDGGPEVVSDDHRS